MKTYKVIFARDEVLMCFETNAGLPNGAEVHHEYNKSGHLIYALVRAESVKDACTKVQPQTRYAQSNKNVNRAPGE
jgi:hypothetical protein